MPAAMVAPILAPGYDPKEKALHVQPDTATPVDQSAASCFKQRDASAAQPVTIAHAMLSIAAKHGDMLAAVVAGKRSAVTNR